MSGLYLQCKRASESLKDGRTVNVPCSIDQHHRSCAIIVDYSSKFNCVQSMVNPRLKG